MLQVKDITKSFDNLRILTNVSLNVADGEILAVTGPSGSGKTTLLQIIGTLDKPDNGQVIFDGNDVTLLRGNDLARFRNLTLGFVFQMHQLLPEFTLLENVMMPALIASQSMSKARNRAAQLLAEVGLEHRGEHKPSQLSGGECQRGAVARALMNKPRVILADEPTGNLDSKNSKELCELFFDVRKKHGTTFVIVTHDIELASRCDRIIHINDGKIYQ